jgi:hypothetical protein
MKYVSLACVVISAWFLGHDTTQGMQLFDVVLLVLNTWSVVDYLKGESE